jgi:FkbM family methyltransferase
MEIQFLNQYRIELPDQFAHERSPMSPETLAERLASGAWEHEEITLLHKYLRPEDSVLEMGACIGVLSVVTHSMLAKSSRHTVIEADPKLISALARNRDLNGCDFEIINAIAGVPDGTEQTFRTSGFILGGSQFKETGGVVSLPVVGLSQFKDDHDFLIMDIEGGEYRFIDTFLEDLRGFSKVMIEFHPFHGYTKEDVNLYIAKLRGLGFRPVERLGHTVLFIKSPPRELHFFVENARQARLAREIIERSGKLGENARVFMLDWQDSEAAFKPELEGMRASAMFIDAAVSLTQKDREAMAKSDHKTRMGLFRDVLFDYCINSKTQHPMVVVVFDDSSPLGLAVSQVCRNSAIDRVLIQSDFLGNVSKTDSPELSDRTWRFGATRPELACVWGPRIAERLTGDLGNRRDRVIVTGRNWPMADSEIQRSRTRNASGKGPRVLWVDQPAPVTGRVVRTSWLCDVRRLSQVLSSQDCRYLSSPDAGAALPEILGLLGPAIRQWPVGTGWEEALGDADVCVTCHSGVFLECLSAGVPCVMVSVDSLDVEMPEIRHPLLWRADGFDALRDILMQFGREENPVSPTDGEDPADYFGSGDGLGNVIDAIGGFISSLEEAAADHPQTEYTKLAGTGFFADGTKTVLAIGGSFGSHIGVGMSLAALHGIRERLPFQMCLHMCNSGSMRRLVQKVRTADVVIINSLEVLALLSTVQLNDLIRLCHEEGRKLYYYPHETNYTFLRLGLELPDKAENFLRNVLPTVHMLCVSEAQQRWLQGLGAASTSVIHEAIAFPFASRPPCPPRGERAIVTMAGTIQPRKGATLFSRAADLAADAGLPLDFHWLGQAIRHAEKCYQSDKVTWRGFLVGREFWDAMSSTDVFALSSVDDPFPLSVGQALFLGKPCVVYRESGFADVIRHMGWGEVCETHDEHEFLDKIRTVAANPDRYRVDFDEVRSLLSVDAFARRLIGSLESVLDSPCFDRETVNSRVGSTLAGECEFFNLTMTLEEEAAAKRRVPCRDIGFRVAHKHFEIEGMVPDAIRNLDPIDLKPIEMAKAMVAIGRHDVARTISEACLVKNPGSRFHQQILEACRQVENNPRAKPAK